MDVHQLFNQSIRSLSDRGVNAIDDFLLSLASAVSRRALSRCVFGCFITALWLPLVLLQLLTTRKHLAAPFTALPNWTGASPPAH